jgi:UPF0755 protein
MATQKNTDDMPVRPPEQRGSHARVTPPSQTTAGANATPTPHRRHAAWAQPARKRTAPAIVAAVVVAVIIVVVVLWVAGTFSSCSSQETVADGTQVQVTVPEGASTKDIASLLYDSKLIATQGDFTNAVDRAGAATALKPGTYLFTGGTSADDIVSQMEQGPTVDVVTVPEGSTLKQTAALVAQATDNRITAKAFRAQAMKASSYAKDYSFIKKASSRGDKNSGGAPYDNSLEGFLFPKTYDIQKDATADDVIRMMLDQYRQETASLDFSQAKKNGLTEYETLILASVIEKEAAADNRATVASVFYNRLKKNMPLQSDATVAYVVGQDPKPSDLKVDSPYNTYQNTGLPAGPICSPSLDSLQAACQPESTDYLYFYFAKDSSGKMQYYFSKTYEQHQEAIEKASGQESSGSSKGK